MEGEEGRSRDPRRADDRPVSALHVVFVAASAVVPTWVAELVSEVATSNRVQVVVSPVTCGTAPTKPLLRLYEKADTAIFGRRSGALDPVALPEGLMNVGEIESCDVVVALVPGDHEPFGSTARLGVWELSHRGTTGRRSEPLAFWECLRGELIETRLEAIEGGGGPRRLLYRSCGAADDASLHRTRNRLLWKSKAAISSQLEMARIRGDAYLSSRPTSAGTAGEPATVRRWHVASLAMRAVAGVLRRRLRGILFVEPWFIGIRRRPAGDAVQFASGPPFLRLDPPSGKAFADPFALDEDGRTFVFFEDYDEARRQARISYVVFDGVRSTGPPASALETGSHLSYPFVFRRGADIYMIPESSADRTITLYRALDFPSRWVPQHVLLDDISAVDATLLEHEGRLWLFAAVFESRASPNDDLHLYSASALDGVWEPHPANPIVADVRRARPAGPIFHHGANLIRPGQDCSRVYGRAIVLNRIDLLTRTEYRETPVATIEPTWDTRLRATHTYSFTDTIELIDGRRPVLRSLRGRAAGVPGRGRGRF